MRNEPSRFAHTGDVQHKVIRLVAQRLQWCAGVQGSPRHDRACTVRVVARAGTEAAPHVCRDMRRWFVAMYCRTRFNPLIDRIARRLVHPCVHSTVSISTNSILSP